MSPYLTYSLIAWGQVAQTHFNKLLLLLRKRALRFMTFSKPRTQAAVPLFISSKVFPVNMLYFETVSTLMYDIFNNSGPHNISRFFERTCLIRSSI